MENQPEQEKDQRKESESQQKSEKKSKQKKEEVLVNIIKADGGAYKGKPKMIIVSILSKPVSALRILYGITTKKNAF